MHIFEFEKLKNSYLKHPLYYKAILSPVLKLLIGHYLSNIQAYIPTNIRRFCSLKPAFVSSFLQHTFSSTFVLKILQIIQISCGHRYLKSSHDNTSINIIKSWEHKHAFYSLKQQNFTFFPTKWNK